MEFSEHEIIYKNELKNPDDVSDWIMEGEGTVSFPKNRMRMESLLPRDAGQKGNIVFWCPETFPDNISISWDFQPLNEPGLAILFFAARGRNGEDIHKGNLSERNGPYDQYHHGDINALHVSYFRRNSVENQFRTSNLRKSYGFHLAARGPDPIPGVMHIQKPYRLKLVKFGAEVSFGVGYNDEYLGIFHWTDDGKKYGPVLGAGKIGFRQMTPLIAEYGNLEIKKVSGK